jgi:hypothetical protein
MAKKGHIMTVDTRKKISNTLSGRKLTKEHRQNISKYQMGHKSYFPDGYVAWNKGKKWSEESRHKMSISAKLRGANNTGMKHTKEALEKMSINRKGKCLKENNGSWNGGTSFLPYSVDWTDTLKISIRERDKYICQICKDKQGDIAFHVHHIDYDKLNCNPNNLITLCNKCHMKTNFNREYWTNYLLNTLEGQTV